MKYVTGVLSSLPLNHSVVKRQFIVHVRRRVIAVFSSFVLGLVAFAAPSVGSMGEPTDPGGTEIPEVDPLGQPYDHELAMATVSASDIHLQLVSEQGYAGVDVDQSTYIITVYWVGAPDPDAVERAMAVAGEAEVTVVTTAREFSFVDLDAAVNTIMSDPIASELGVIGAGYFPDLSGVEVSMATEGPVATAADLERVLDLDVPILSVVQVDDEFATGRNADTGSLDGGARIHVPQEAGGRRFCTSGVNVLHNGTRGMLTAWHCKNGPRNPRIEVPSGAYRGTFSVWSQGLDVAVFNGYSSGYSSWVYVGTWNAAQASRHAVGAPISPAAVSTLPLCLRGSASGDLCSQVATRLGYSHTLEGRLYTNLFVTSSTVDGLPVIRPVDSGGPVVRHIWSTSQGRWVSRPVGLGHSVAGTRYDPDDCPGDPNVNTRCGTIARYSDLANAATHLGFTVVGPGGTP